MSSQNEKGQVTVQEQEVESEDSKAQAEKQKKPPARNDASQEEPEKLGRKPPFGYCHDTSMGPYGFNF